jgi:predicted ATP-binding protein involved in virulence
MHLTKIQLTNFRCYENLDIDLDPGFNIMVGVNGTGKTAILEAVRIAIGSLFLEVDKVQDKISSPGISDKDVRLLNMEMQYPVNISASALFGNHLTNVFSSEKNKEISWTRSVEKRGGRTIKTHANEMKKVSACLQGLVRNGHKEVIPIVVYYSTDRFKREKKDSGIVAEDSRLSGYYNALDPLTNTKFFLDLFKTETLSSLQHNVQSILLEAVSNAIMCCVDDCKRVYHDVKRDKLLIELRSINDLMPFNFLSDGVRSTLAMVMDIAFRCCLLNPHLMANAPLQTTGVVLIDEIDLHLHPSWQKKIIGDLRRAFPNIQFIVTTHAPLVIGSLKQGKIFSITYKRAYNFPIQYGRDANAILSEMDTEPMDETLRKEIDNYFLLIENGHGNDNKTISVRKHLQLQLGENHPELQRADLLLSFF